MIAVSNLKHVVIRKRHVTIATIFIFMAIAISRFICILNSISKINRESLKISKIEINYFQNTKNNTDSTNLNNSNDETNLNNAKHEINYLDVSLYMGFKDCNSPINISIENTEFSLFLENNVKINAKVEVLSLKKKDPLGFVVNFKLTQYKLFENILDDIANRNYTLKARFYIISRFCFIPLYFFKSICYEQGRNTEQSDTNDRIQNILNYFDHEFLDDRTLKIGLKSKLFVEEGPFKNIHIVINVGIINFRFNGVFDGCLLINSFDTTFYTKNPENISTNTMEEVKSKVNIKDNENLKYFIPGISITEKDKIYYFLTIRIDNDFKTFLDKLTKPNSTMNENLSIRSYSLNNNQLNEGMILKDLFHCILNDDQGILDKAIFSEINTNVGSVYESAFNQNNTNNANKTEDIVPERCILIRNMIIDNNELRFSLSTKKSDIICLIINSILKKYFDSINTILVLKYGGEQLVQCTTRMLRCAQYNDRYNNIADFTIRFNEEIELCIDPSKHFQLFINLLTIGSMNIDLNNDLCIEMVDNKLNLVYKNSSILLLEINNGPKSLPFSVNIDHLLSDYKSSGKDFTSSTGNMLGRIVTIDSKIDIQSINPIKNNLSYEKMGFDDLISNILDTDKPQANLDNLLKNLQTIHNMIGPSIHIIFKTPNITMLVRSKYVQMRSLINESTMYYNTNKGLLLGTMKIDSLCYYRCIPEKMNELSLEGLGIDKFDITIENLFKLKVVISDKKKTCNADEINTNKKSNTYILPFNIKTEVYNSDNEIKILNNVNNNKSLDNPDARYPKYFTNLVNNSNGGIIKNTIRAKNISYVHDFNINMPILLRIENIELVHVVFGNNNLIYLGKPFVLTTKFVKMDKRKDYDLQYEEILNNSSLHFFIEAVISSILNIPKNNVLEPVLNIVEEIYLNYETNFGMDQSKMSLELRFPLDMFKFEEFIKFDTSIEEIKLEVEENYNLDVGFNMYVNDVKEVTLKAHVCLKELIDLESKYVNLYINREFVDRYQIKIEDTIKFILERILAFTDSKYKNYNNLFKKFSMKYNVHKEDSLYANMVFDDKSGMLNEKSHEFLNKLGFSLFHSIDIKNTVFEDIIAENRLKIKNPMVLDIGIKEMEFEANKIAFEISMWSDYIIECIKETCATIVTTLPTRNLMYKLNININISNEIIIEGLPILDLLPKSFYNQKPLTIEFYKGFRANESQYINKEEYKEFLKKFKTNIDNPFILKLNGMFKNTIYDKFLINFKWNENISVDTVNLLTSIYKNISEIFMINSKYQKFLKSGCDMQSSGNDLSINDKNYLHKSNGITEYNHLYLKLPFMINIISDTISIASSHISLICIVAKLLDSKNISFEMACAGFRSVVTTKISVKLEFNNISIIKDTRLDNLHVDYLDNEYIVTYDAIYDYLPINQEHYVFICILYKKKAYARYITSSYALLDLFLIIHCGFYYSIKRKDMYILILKNTYTNLYKFVVSQFINVYPDDEFMKFFPDENKLIFYMQKQYEAYCKTMNSIRSS